MRKILPMTPEQQEIIAKLKEIEEQIDYVLAESNVPGLARSRALHVRNLARYLRSLIGSSKLTLIKSDSRDG